MRTTKFLSVLLVAVTMLTSMTACHTSKKVTNRRYMSTLKRDLKRHIKDADVSKAGDTVRVVYPELVMFDFDKDQVKAQALPSMERFANTLRDYCLVHVIVNGYTDNTGTDEVNLSLSKRRAENAKNTLETDGVGNTRIVTHGLGSANPIMSNKTPEGRQANRRVEFVIYEGK
ncbi:MAG: OmpA family protein [Flavipsychrobacter sp.]|nr:OmpA family protein [Flavipsychrobacter sp.]